MTDTTIQEGGCSCGDVRYQMLAEPMFVHCCHCTCCQQQTGAAFAVNAIIESDHVKLIKGTVAYTVVPSPSGRGQEIARCPTCHVALWSHYGGLGKKASFVRVGTLGTGHTISPDAFIYTSTKQPWVQIPDGMLAVPEYYNMKETWPAESQRRLSALLKS
ncbi:GFA family protein [Kordiimonas pumila]|uniref:GFA family protein n=1 Tax=Kordiimonas pumila TaxID=2161677 RepID=A0ABV7D1M8_9PROT|nr:GFA family protein [Kordiimonas pumila]